MVTALIGVLTVSLGAFSFGKEVLEDYFERHFGRPPFASKHIELAVRDNTLERLRTERDRLLYLIATAEEEQKRLGDRFPFAKQQQLNRWKSELIDKDAAIKRWIGGQ